MIIIIVGGRASDHRTENGFPLVRTRRRMKPSGVDVPYTLTVLPVPSFGVTRPSPDVTFNYLAASPSRRGGLVDGGDMSKTV